MVLFSLALLGIYNPYIVAFINIYDACKHNYGGYSCVQYYKAVKEVEEKVEIKD